MSFLIQGWDFKVQKCFETTPGTTGNVLHKNTAKSSASKVFVSSVLISLWGVFYKQEIRTWIIDHMPMKEWNIITNPCHDFKLKLFMAG